MTVCNAQSKTCIIILGLISSADSKHVADSLKFPISAKEFPLLHKVSTSAGLILSAASKHFIASLCFDFPAKTIPLLFRVHYVLWTDFQCLVVEGYCLRVFAKCYKCICLVAYRINISWLYL